MSLILAGLIVAGAGGAAAVGRWLARRRDEEKAGSGEGTGTEPEGDPKPSEDGTERASKPAVAGGAPKVDEPKKRPPARKLEGAHAHLEGFPCQLGDVIMRLTGEEAWLAGGLVLSEEVPVSAVFVAPDAGHDCVVYVRPKPREAVVWLEPLDPSAVLVGGEPPSSVEYGGIRFDRQRRLPLRLKRVGVGAPDVGDSLVLAEYAAAGAERLLLLKGSSGTTVAYRGMELEPSTYEVIASGRSTLDD